MVNGKICSTCKTEKDSTTCFARRGIGLYGVCRVCKSEYNRKWYAKNQEAQKKRTVKLKAAGRAFITEYKKSRACMDCGYSNPEYPSTLDFDHVSGTKVKDLGSIQSWSVERILNEIGKCNLVCANCHRIRTVNRRSHRPIG